MKNVSVIIGLALLLGLAANAALPQPDLILRVHFAGGRKISADPHAAAFTNEFCSADALTLRAQTATRLCEWLAGWLQTSLNTRVPDGAAKLLPLFDDLQQSEFFLEIRAAANASQPPEAAIAIKLEPARARLWQSGLTPFFPTATFKSIGGWTIFDSKPASPGLGDRLAQQISAPPATWLDLDVNWPRLAQWHPLLKELALPETQFSLTAPGDYFNIAGKFFFPENLTLNLEPWRMPTNTIHSPFSSFTAVRGFAPWYQSQPWAIPFQLNPTPNQLVLWALPAFPFRTFASIPVPDAANALSQAYQRLAPFFHDADILREFATTITPGMSNNEIDFDGVPYTALKMRALKEPAGQFLYTELFPNSVKSKPLPPELYRRLETKNLVFYHYERTSDRIQQLLQVTQLGLALSLDKQLDGHSAAFRWVQAIGTNLVVNPARDHTDTEITQTGPAEFTFARKSPAILTGLEFYALANWIEATNFPGCNLKLPSRRNRGMKVFPPAQHGPAQAPELRH